MSINLNDLKADMPYKWKVQTASQYGCQCVAYVDSRQVQDKLDNVVGPANWQDKYYTIDGQLYCSIGIYDADKKDWVWKTDCGTESMTEKEKGQASDAFKRAAVKWGVGRFLYSLKIQKVAAVKNSRGKYEPADNNGKKIWDLTKHINALNPPTASINLKANAVQPGGGVNTAANPNRYNASKGGANASYNKVEYSPETIKKVQSLSKDNKKGRDVLNDYLPKYNESKGKTFAKISDLTEADLKDLIVFIEDTPPADL